jgi:hypothetical protein
MDFGILFTDAEGGSAGEVQISCPEDHRVRFGGS